MNKKQRNTAWLVAHGMKTKADAARALNVSPKNVDTQLFNGLVAELQYRGVIK